MNSRPRVKRPNPVDAKVGHRVQLRRQLLRISQTALATQLGVSFQQLQKCEKGINRIGAGRLYEIAVILRVPISYFYAGLAPPEATDGSATSLLVEEAAVDDVVDREALRLARLFGRIQDPATRKIIAALIKELGKPSTEA